MANESTNNAKKEKFIGLLHELFQLNQPELDFGLYRIMHAKSDQIKAFIQNDLAREIDEAFADSGDDKISKLKASYEQARAQAVEFGIPDPDSNPKVKEAKEAYDAARDNGDDPSDIYDHLYRFFSRYYDKGDFLSRRYHVGENESRAAPYAVPYDGREVYLHWANKDQYYIKSSEYLSNFSFDLQGAIEKELKRQGLTGQGALGLDDGSTKPDKVTFQLVDAAEGAHNNVKENQARFFIIHAHKPVEVRPLVSAEYETEGYELIINFEYRPDPEKSGQEGSWQKKRLQEAETAILEALKADESLKPFYDALTFLAPTEKDKARTLLAKYLNSYTARNTMDYFIHKDLGGFLRRELDFYIKNEIMRLDDLSNDDIVGVTHSLKKIMALRSIARQIIDFLSQLENFQKKLWLKKKFVTEVNYCITLDRVPDPFYEEILANEKQWKEWQEFGFLETLTPSLEILHKQSSMMLDTSFFDQDFKERLLAEIHDLDEQCDGILIHADNFQGLNFIKPSLGESIDCVHIDPPYNTSSSGFLYKNTYEHSSWLSMMLDRINLSNQLMSKEGVFICHIDEHEVERLQYLLDDIFEVNLGTLIWDKGAPVTGANGLATQHEYVLWRANHSSELKVKKQNISAMEKKAKSLIAKYGEANSECIADWRKWLRENKSLSKAEAIYDLLDDFGEIFRSADMTATDKRSNEKFHKPLLHPDTNLPCPVPSNGWRYTPETIQNLIENNLILFGEDHSKIPRRKILITDNESSQMPSVVRSGFRGKQELDALGLQFPFAHSTEFYKYLLNAQHRNDQIVLDYFAGSGTTGSSVISLNREDEGNRKYVLIEMGEQFETTLRPRIQKNVFSSSWKSGKPVVTDAGISHCFKYLRLESYEDSLNNLNVSADHISEDLLTQQGNIELRKDYYINYFLDVETRGSASLLNVLKFSDPNAYTLMVKKPGSDTQVPTNLDLVETFNWLLGLEVALLDKPRTYAAEFEREHDPELPEDQHTRLEVKRFKEDEQGSYWFRVVEGFARRTPGSDANKEKVMVIWRKLSDDPEKDAAALEALLSKYRVNQSDSEYDKIFINGPHGLRLSGQAKAKLLSLEETFMARMWEDTDGVMH